VLSLQALFGLNRPDVRPSRGLDTSDFAPWPSLSAPKTKGEKKRGLSDLSKVRALPEAVCDLSVVFSQSCLLRQRVRMVSEASREAALAAGVSAERRRAGGAPYPRTRAAASSAEGAGNFRGQTYFSRPPELLHGGVGIGRARRKRGGKWSERGSGRVRKPSSGSGTGGDF